MSDAALRPAGEPGAPSEVWLLDLLDADGPRDLAALAPADGWRAVPHGASRNGTALVAAAGADELDLAPGPETRLRLLRHPWSGPAALRHAGGTRELDLHAAADAIVEVRADGALAEGAVTGPEGERRTAPLGAWLAEVAEHAPAAVGLVHPDWRGVRAATEHQLSYVLAVPADPSGEDAEELAERLAATGVPAVVAAGLPPGHRPLVRALHARGVRCLVTWHATFLQYGEPVNHEVLTANVALARAGVIERIGFTKVGMAQAFERRGIPSATILNALRGSPRQAPAGDGRLGRVGIWSVAPVWRKLPYAMLAACAELDPPPRVYASGRDPALAALAELLGVPLEAAGGPVPAAEMDAALAACDLNLYVTLSECGPMVVLESLLAGRPCLLGPNSHYFDEHDDLRRRLVVGEPDRHERIAAAMRRAFDAREEIMRAFREDFWPGYRERAERSVREFVGAGEDDLV